MKFNELNTFRLRNFSRPDCSCSCIIKTSSSNFIAVFFELFTLFLSAWFCSSNFARIFSSSLSIFSMSLFRASISFCIFSYWLVSAFVCCTRYLISSCTTVVNVYKFKQNCILVLKIVRNQNKMNFRY